ncbi:unnamed protein product [Cyclocybe aegerita]|uniref:F-box domain-containing protein n=1 Tax=Cyclocybe aegerita TaxID=1973307 RepID=A0A8S0W9W6_CYCAE|nr:unnamed protein product [Cyclocybe aegerita]
MQESRTTGWLERNGYLKIVRTEKLTTKAPTSEPQRNAPRQKAFIVTRYHCPFHLLLRGSHPEFIHPNVHKFTHPALTRRKPSSKRKEIQSYLAQTITKVEALDQAIDWAQAFLEALQFEKETKITQIQTDHTSRSSIQRLPGDILEKIFVETLPIHRNSTMSFDDFPLKLGIVCNDWRDLAHSCSSLWSTIHIAIPAIGFPGAADPTPITPEHEWQMEIKVAMSLKYSISEWLGRANGRPLSISVGSQLREDVAEEAVEIIVSALVPFANQWRNLDLQFPMSTLVQRMLGQIQEMPETPNLRSLRMRDTKPYNVLDTHPDVYHFIRKLLPSSSNLQQFNAFYFDMTHREQLSVPWSKLTKLSLVRCRIARSQIVAILRLASRLVSSKYPGAEFQPDGAISLPMLEEFSFFEHMWLLVPFRLPRLQRLKFEGRVVFPGALNPLERFDIVDLLSHQTQLTSLRLNLTSLNENTLVEVLALVPYLKHLSFENPSDPRMVQIFNEHPPQQNTIDGPNTCDPHSNRDCRWNSHRQLVPSHRNI